jgi:hypothetical protein
MQKLSTKIGQSNSNYCVNREKGRAFQASQDLWFLGSECEPRAFLSKTAREMPAVTNKAPRAARPVVGEDEFSLIG